MKCVWLSLCWCWCLFLGARSSTALADRDVPVVAPHPLELRRAPRLTAKELRSLRSEFLRLLVAAGSRTADTAELESALAAISGRACGHDDACLAALARGASARFASYVTLDVDASGTLVSASGRVVADDGKLMSGPATSTAVLGGPATPLRFVAGAKQALATLVPALARFSAERSERPPTPSAAIAPSSHSVALVDRGPAPAPSPSVLPWALLGAGAAVTAGGGLLLGLAASDANRLRTNPQGNLLVEQVPLYAEAQNKELLGQAMLATGAAALTGGLAVLFFGPRQTTVALAPTKQGTSVLVSGAWP